ncbi:MAG: AbrB/MazE/SpoVT family DNA-binding domain-containing protein [Candidatus Asgardarchaeia archaeon]
MKVAILEKAKISKNYQVVIPSEIRRYFNVKPGDEVIWAIIDGKLKVKIVSKRKRPLVDLIGALDMGETDASKDIDDVVIGE